MLSDTFYQSVGAVSPEALASEVDYARTQHSMTALEFNRMHVRNMNFQPKEAGLWFDASSDFLPSKFHHEFSHIIIALHGHNHGTKGLFHKMFYDGNIESEAFVETMEKMLERLQYKKENIMDQHEACPYLSEEVFVEEIQTRLGEIPSEFALEEYRGCLQFLHANPQLGPMTTFEAKRLFQPLYDPEKPVPENVLSGETNIGAFPEVPLDFLQGLYKSHMAVLHSLENTIEQIGYDCQRELSSAEINQLYKDITIAELNEVVFTREPKPFSNKKIEYLDFSLKGEKSDEVDIGSFEA